MIQEFLNQRLFDVGENDEQLKKLEKTAGDISKTLLSKRTELIPYTLVALDTEVSADEPRIEQAMAELTKNWNTVRSRFAATPVTVLRAIIAEALHKAAKSDVTAASIIWLTAASYAPHAVLGNEKGLWLAFLEEVGAIAEKQAVAVWDGNLASERLQFPSPQLPPVKMPTVQQVDPAILQKYFVAAASPDGGDAGNIKRNRHYPTNSYANTEWTEPFARIAAGGIAKVVNEAWAKTSDGLEGAEEFQKALASYMNEVGVTIQRALAPVVANTLRTRLLWWKEARFSPSLRCDYGSLDLMVRPLVMAADLHGQAPAYCPQSVDFFLADAVGQVGSSANVAQSEEGYTVEAYIKALAEAKLDLSKLLPKAKEHPGRVPLIDYIRRKAVDGLSPGPSSERLRLTDAVRLKPSEFAMWIFRDLQAHRLASQK